MRLLFLAWAFTLGGCELVDPVSRLGQDYEGGSDAAPSCLADGADPCATITPKGCYCGVTTQDGFNPNQANNTCLYLCEAGTVVSTIYCASGCIVEGAGTQDQCKVSNARCF